MGPDFDLSNSLNWGTTRLRTVKNELGMTLSVVRDMFEYRSRRALGRTSKGDDLESRRQMEVKRVIV